MHAFRSLAAALVAGAVSFTLTQQAGAAPSQIVDPYFEWSFEQYLSDGVGSVQPPEPAEPPGSQFGGELSEQYFHPFSGTPNMEVFSNGTGTTFWASARSPFGSPLLRDVPLGSRSTLVLTQTFQKEEENATLSFTISQIALDAFEPGTGPPGRDGLSAYVSFDVVALDQSGNPFFSFLDETSLTGEGTQWDLDDLSGPLVTEIVFGGEDESSISARLASPFTQAIDLSALDSRDIFTVRYTVVVEAIDTEQFESRISAFARDPLDGDLGSYFEFTGLTPLATVPEPGTALLLLSGMGALAVFGRRRRG